MRSEIAIYHGWILRCDQPFTIDKWSDSILSREWSESADGVCENMWLMESRQEDHKRRELEQKLLVGSITN